jgi:5-methylcytosine-specific restriction endonuclease McrA
MREDILNWKHYKGGSVWIPFLELVTMAPLSDDEFRYLINNSSENVGRHEKSHYDPVRVCLNTIHNSDRYRQKNLPELDKTFLQGDRINFKGFLKRIGEGPMSDETFNDLVKSSNTTGDYDENKQNAISNSDKIREIANKLHAQDGYIKHDANPSIENLYSSDKIRYDLEEKIIRSKSDDSSVRKSRLKKASKIPERIQITSAGFIRNPDVITEVLLRASGICEWCQKPAPFIRKKDKTPYLEVHHKIMLSNGGEDTTDNAIALCPNCHKEQHFGV